MLGSIIGDYVGSPFEFNNRKHFAYTQENLLSFGNKFTDDSVCTIAIADSLLNSKPVVETLQSWCKKFPDVGYGGHFYEWIYSKDPKPYNSCGNGCAMRISPVAYFAKSMDDCISISNSVTEITHNHSEGLKGAKAVSTLMYNILNENFTMNDCRDYAIGFYPEIKDFDIEDLYKNYCFEVLAQKSIPQAIFAFLESKDFESCMRLSLKISGDCDTLACIAGGIAESFYKEIPQDLVDRTTLLLDNSMIKIINQFREFLNLKNK